MSDPSMKAALEAKRKKLELLKKKREERKKLKELAEKERVEKERRLHELEEQTSHGGMPHGYFDQQAESVLSSVGALLGDAPPELPPQPSPTNAAPASSSVTTDSLSVSKPITENIAPVEVHKYDKEVQVGTQDELKAEQDAAKAAEDQAAAAKVAEEKAKRERELEEMQSKLLQEHQEVEEKQLVLSKEERNKIISTPSFLDFFKRSTVLVERAMFQNQRYDLTRDYSEELADEEKMGTSLLSHRIVLHEHAKTYNRPVTSIDWSPQFKELLLASYAHKEDNLSLDPDGLVMVWSTELDTRPEYRFTCQSAVLTAQFHPSNPLLIIGGTQSGQLVVWDTRARSTPVIRTSLSHGHTHPVYSLQAISSADLLYNIVSCSSDGLLCVWKDSDLVEPDQQVPLLYQHEKKKEEEAINPICMSIPGRDAAKVVLGGDDGYIYKAAIRDSPGVKKQEAIKAHEAPVTNVEFHPTDRSEHKDFADLFLSCSYDWTAKLWTQGTSRLLFSFETARDYVYDCAWSPRHASLFCTGDGVGGVDFWDLVRDTEVPVHRETLKPLDGKGDRAVSKVRWSADGNKLAVGTSEGVLYAFDVDQSIAAPPPDVQDRFYKVIKKAMI